MHGKDRVRVEEGRRERFTQAGREQADHGWAENRTVQLRAAIPHVLAVSKHSSLLAETPFLGRDTPHCLLSPQGAGGGWDGRGPGAVQEPARGGDAGLEPS